MGIIEISSAVLSYTGAAIILYGGVLALINTVKREVWRSSEISYMDIRRDFTNKIIFGLDFLIASDIMRTIVAPSTQEVLLLGAIVVIRTVMGYFLSKEVKEFECKV